MSSRALHTLVTGLLQGAAQRCNDGSGAGHGVQPPGLEGAVWRNNYMDIGALPDAVRELIPAPVRRLDGSLLVWGFAARGDCIYHYQMPGGSVRAVYRPARVVYDSHTLDSFCGVPVTVGHPPEFVTPSNAAQYTCGTVLEAGKVFAQFGLVAVPMILTSQEALDAYKAGRTSLSTGEWCVEVEAAGTWEGQPYTHRLDLMAVNHLALVDVPRAGGLAQIRTHSAQPGSPPIAAPEPVEPRRNGAGATPMDFVQITVGGITCWVPAGEQETARARIERELQARINSASEAAVSAREAVLVAQHEQAAAALQASIDERDGRIAALEAAPTEEQVTERVNSMVRESLNSRLDTAAKYAPLFGGKQVITRTNAAGEVKTISLALMDREELLREGILARRPNAADKIQGKGLPYLEAYADQLLEHIANSDASQDALDAASQEARTNAADGGEARKGGAGRLEKARNKLKEKIEGASRRTA